MNDLTTTIKCNHELVARVSPAGDDFTSCNKCGGHWCGWDPQGDRYTRTDGNLQATLTLVEGGWKYEVWRDEGAATPKWVASGESLTLEDAEALSEQEMRIAATRYEIIADAITKATGE